MIISAFTVHNPHFSPDSAFSVFSDSILSLNIPVTTVYRVAGDFIIAYIYYNQRQVSAQNIIAVAAFSRSVPSAFLLSFCLQMLMNPGAFRSVKGIRRGHKGNEKNNSAGQYACNLILHSLTS